MGREGGSVRGKEIKWRKGEGKEEVREEEIKRKEEVRREGGSKRGKR